MISALVAGRVLGVPVSRVAANGNRFATAKVRAVMRNGEAAIVNVMAFADAAATALLALQDGDSVALAGELTIGTYVSKDGSTRPSLDLVAHALLSPFEVQRRRSAEVPFDDPLPPLRATR